MTTEQLIITEIDDHIGIIRLNRPKVLNAINPELITLVAEQLEAWDKDQNIYVTLITGNEKAFAAGADISDMAKRKPFEMYDRDQFGAGFLQCLF